MGKVFYIIRKAKNLNEYLQFGSTIKNQKWSGDFFAYGQVPYGFDEGKRYIITSSDSPDFENILKDKEEKTIKKKKNILDKLFYMDAIKTELGIK
ncbi:MAG: hypothetical protein KKB62_01405 [Nanoarchaeota archaeon]|nr:hypothetical protein [Nanoarchaeota archaeon]